MRSRPRPATIVSIHNIAFQGQFPKELLEPLRLPPRAFAIDGVEYYGAIGFLKAGLQLADRITTVSPSYAREIETPEFGMGLEGLLRARADRVSGILNGVDEETWDPATDAHLGTRYDHWSLPSRARNKAALQKRLRLRVDPDAFLIGVVSRLSWQKGLDLLLDVLPQLMRGRAQLALLGAGDKTLEEGFAAAEAAHPGRVGVHIGYSEELAHMIQAGADAFLVPSRFEPCGLTQLYALRYGAVPIVSRVGGLKDTIVDANEMALQADVATGLQFSPTTAEALALALREAERLFEDAETWRKIQVNGMRTDVSWRNPARRYAKLFRDAVAAKVGDFSQVCTSWPALCRPSTPYIRATMHVCEMPRMISPGRTAWMPATNAGMTNRAGAELHDRPRHRWRAGAARRHAGCERRECRGVFRSCGGDRALSLR